MADHVEQDTAIGLLLELEDDALLAAIDKAEIQRLPLVERTVGTCVVTVAGLLDVDDTSAKVVESRRPERAVEAVRPTTSDVEKGPATRWSSGDDIGISSLPEGIPLERARCQRGVPVV